MINDNITSPDNTGENREITRDEKGRFIEGCSGNPSGRPAGSVSITTEIKKKLDEVPEGQKKTYLELLINKIVRQAIIDGNEQMIKFIWNYVDGMPEHKVSINQEAPIIIL